MSFKDFSELVGLRNCLVFLFWIFIIHAFKLDPNANSITNSSIFYQINDLPIFQHMANVAQKITFYTAAQALVLTCMSISMPTLIINSFFDLLEKSLDTPSQIRHSENNKKVTYAEKKCTSLKKHYFFSTLILIFSSSLIIIYPNEIIHLSILTFTSATYSIITLLASLYYYKNYLYPFLSKDITSDSSYLKDHFRLL
ncbi:hypothetical protein Desal_2533 [Maridesulfovibrio salexigens DSM 2638]|uniref:Uncharacterized protein n=1 Tax=Maridesulfovibrio salexigens (strain ATCC 14822 / DSM 2638 / NCIMB 8403 / VKM B-1763) TaxID=526222 RepID=C6BY59_MARSD|nr:hypothetical protein Desal_2533 [Maridesulfovibrio salexigens DSM 2638]